MGVDLGKAKKILSSTFLEDNENINEDQAAHLIVKAEQQIKGLTEEMETDDRLNAALQIAKDLKSGYTNAVKYEQAKIQYLLSKIEEIQGSDAPPSDP